MKDSLKCPRCKSEMVEKGHQEMFPSTFMKEGTKFAILKALTSSKEFDLYACTDCGYTEWYIKGTGGS